MELIMKYLVLLCVLASFNLRAEISSADIAIPDEAIESPNMDIEGLYVTKEEVKTDPAAINGDKLAKDLKAIKEDIIVKGVDNKMNDKKLSQIEIMREQRKILEEKNRLMLEQELEKIRYNQELDLAKQLEHAMNQTLDVIESVNKKQ